MVDSDATSGRQITAFTDCSTASFPQTYASHEQALGPELFASYRIAFDVAVDANPSGEAIFRCCCAPVAVC